MNGNGFKRLLKICFLILLLGQNSTGSAYALFELMDVDVIWTSLIGQDPSTFQGIGTNEVRWGTPLTGQKPGLRFDGSAPPPTSISIGDPFDLGTFTHFNFVTAVGTAVSSADISILLQLDNNGDLFSPDPLDFSFNIEETLNFFSVNSCPSFQKSSLGCDDRITFPKNFPTETFFVDNQELTLELLGFQVGGETVPAFITEEKKSNSAVLLGRITQLTPPPPPDNGGGDTEPPPQEHPQGSVELQDAEAIVSVNDIPHPINGAPSALWSMQTDGTLAQFNPGTDGFNPNNPTVVLVHGWAPDNINDDGTLKESFPEWASLTVQNPDGTAQMLGKRTDDINVLAWDWMEVASTTGSLPQKRDTRGLPWPGFEVSNQGVAMAKSLRETLGEYDKPIQFIGHSLGGGVSTFGGVILDRYGYNVDQITIFDAPEVGRITAGNTIDIDFTTLYLEALLQNAVNRRDIWIDNYPTLVGRSYNIEEINNEKGDLVNFEILGDPGNNLHEKWHEYPMSWYFGIADNFPPAEEGTLYKGFPFPGFPNSDVGAYWSKALNPVQSDQAIDMIRKELGSSSVYEARDPGSQPYTLMPRDVQDDQTETHVVKVDLGENTDAWLKKGDVYFLNGVYHLATASPVFLFREYSFLSDSEYMSFDFLLENPALEDDLLFFVGTDPLFRFQGSSFPEDWDDFLNSGPINVSEYAGTNQWLTFLYNSDEAGHRAQIANINLYRFEENTNSSVVPEPSTLLMLGMGMGTLFRFRNRRKRIPSFS